jgi:hypothetical protein
MDAGCGLPVSTRGQWRGPMTCNEGGGGGLASVWHLVQVSSHGCPNFYDDIYGYCCYYVPKIN